MAVGVGLVPRVGGVVAFRAREVWGAIGRGAARGESSCFESQVYRGLQIDLVFRSGTKFG